MDTPAAPAPAARARGFTLVELMVVAVVLAMLAAMAAPPLAAMAQRHRLLDTGRLLQAELASARQQALPQGREAYLVVRPGADWCWSISLDQPVDCQAPTADRGTATGQLLRQGRADDHGQVVALRGGQWHLNGQNGLRVGTAPTLLLGTPQGARLALNLGLLGRASLCSPEAPLAGIPRCAATADVAQPRH